MPSSERETSNDAHEQPLAAEDISHNLTTNRPRRLFGTHTDTAISLVGGTAATLGGVALAAAPHGKPWLYAVGLGLEFVAADQLIQLGSRSDQRRERLIYVKNKLLRRNR